MAKEIEWPMSVITNVEVRTLKEKQQNDYSWFCAGCGTQRSSVNLLPSGIEKWGHIYFEC